jgi:OmcA/MtrC family decaheme c-type cytochrome
MAAISVRSKLLRYIFLPALFLLFLVVISACTGPAGAQGSPGPQGEPGAAAPGEGLALKITGVEIPGDLRPVVTFSLQDGRGKPLEPDLLDANSLRFTITRLSVDSASGISQYVSYVTSQVQGQEYTFKGKTTRPALESALQAISAMDQGGEFQRTKAGEYNYKFKTVLPADYDKSATHAVGAQATRDTRKFVGNDVFYFVPAGGATTAMRQVVATESCNQCHGQLAAHGGQRTDTKLCVLCHTSQTTDPESGNSVEMKVMVHRIHKSLELPSVKEGKPYLIVGFNQSVHDFSAIHLPVGMDVRSCTTCHGAAPLGVKAEDYPKLAPQADNWKTAPSRAACGACHDDVDFASGKGHQGGPQPNDAACKACHTADSGKEFDASIVGAHTIPAKSKQLAGLEAEIIGVTNTGPGEKPMVVFTAKDKSGKVIPLSGLTGVSLHVAGPTTDYVNQWSETPAAGTIVDRGGTFSYTFNRGIPADATGTYAVGLQMGRVESITVKDGEKQNVTIYAYNPVKYIAVTDPTPVPRRTIVATESCNQCHSELAFHGGGRKNLGEFCQLCHNPANVDVPHLVPPTFGGPFKEAPQSINFRFMIHRIHTGAELTRDFTIYRTRGVFNFNEVEFPADRRECSKCHVGDSYKLPLPATMADTRAPREFYTPLGPAASACLGCHDSKNAAAHAQAMTAPIGESCSACHGQGKDFDVAKVHSP